MKFKLFALLILQLSLSTHLSSQDLGFSQYYNAPIFLNPAFAGASEFSRAGFNFRMQKVGSLAAYSTSLVAFDHSFKDYHSSFGLMMINETDETSGYRHIKIAIPIVYDFSVSKDFGLRFGLQGSYSEQNYNVGNFLFSDQLDPFGNVIGPSGETLANGRINYFDASFGVLGFSKKVWFGFAAHNLFKNDVSFMEGSEYILNTRYSGHMGYKIRLNKLSRQNKRDIAIMPTFSYTSQGSQNRLDIGLYNMIDPLIFGVFYGVDPFAIEQSGFVSMMMGLKKFSITTLYSYDMSLTQGSGLQGFHEISFSYLFDLSNNGKPPLAMRRSLCPVFL
jgi:type IX secretion system PorP/SprF family membrane protein|tara:strand:- start:423 stop:1421 length:999 start_codon:yes stop_codon:yes gene_type:complete